MQSTGNWTLSATSPSQVHIMLTVLNRTIHIRHGHQLKIQHLPWPPNRRSTSKTQCEINKDTSFPHTHTYSVTLYSCVVYRVRACCRVRVGWDWAITSVALGFPSLYRDTHRECEWRLWKTLNRLIAHERARSAFVMSRHIVKAKMRNNIECKQSLEPSRWAVEHSMNTRTLPQYRGSCLHCMFTHIFRTNIQNTIFLLVRPSSRRDRGEFDACADEYASVHHPYTHYNTCIVDSTSSRSGRLTYSSALLCTRYATGTRWSNAWLVECTLIT